MKIGIVCASDDELAPFLTMKKYIVNIEIKN